MSDRECPFKKVQIYVNSKGIKGEISENDFKNRSNSVAIREDFGECSSKCMAFDSATESCKLIGKLERTNNKENNVIKELTTFE